MMIASCRARLPTRSDVAQTRGVGALYQQRDDVDDELMQLAESEDFTMKQKAVMSAKLKAKRERLDAGSSMHRRRT
ncbi:hypothetical protein [Nocardia transvalensis]|uniref:hypothetical protein n=1 Tax=Nocardia transvalensis TaxID=37333 RepID=UPI001896223B|nr:hypothetical protein [Nocardia transvalensis]MBF6330831.1 hypothetical protein [Nocardia transvalensis]